MSKDKTKAKESKAAVFFKGVKAEFRKIIWPDRDTLLKQLAAVLVVTVLLGVVIALIDFGFQNLIDLLTGITIGG
ncbi:MAG: preprotein translocase subunit SecE [Lachnospiraceae bacterium]|nr:preprotein translocase subunit SecE [Bacillota bacterium]MCI6594578.1 preprotein translocase subunit SecE [Bacillota bacterium]MDD7254102.1 preprotein translocase subunit SecE [Bacillota bacterium]MDO5592440.1 preprotein translocase subunit SecE [Bacillota bacterium]MDY2949674.1 preprotein translocase subunit SecE [Lachnospiraceae bacterium]